MLALRHAAVAVALSALVAQAEGAAGNTEVVSLKADASGAAGGSLLNFTGKADRSISADGRYVVFVSFESTFGPRDGNGDMRDVYLRDRQTGKNEKLSVALPGAWTDGESDRPSITPDGRFVAFESNASKLVAGDTNHRGDVFVRDRKTGFTERISVNSGGVQGNDTSREASISADGRYVAFASVATNFLPGGATDFIYRVYVRDRQTGSTELASVDSSGVPGSSFSYWPSISGDGRYVAFDSASSNLVAGDGNDASDSFVHDRQTGITERVSVDSSGAEGNASSYSTSISADGRYVAFYSEASNLVPDDSSRGDVFVHDRQTGTTELVSVAWDGGPSDNWISGAAVSINGDGRYVAFYSDATNLVTGDTNGLIDVFVRDRQAGTTKRVSVDSSGAQGNGPSGENVSISADGRFVAFDSWSPDLVPNDFNESGDIYLRDRGGSTSPEFAFTLQPSSLAFGNQPVPGSSTQNLWLRNKGATTLPIGDVVLRGADKASFAVTHSCGSSVAVDAGCSIRVTFRPTTVGEKSATLRVVAGDGLVRTRDLAGTGVPAGF